MFRLAALPGISLAATDYIQHILHPRHRQAGLLNAFIENLFEVAMDFFVAFRLAVPLEKCMRYFRNLDIISHGTGYLNAMLGI